MTLDRNRQNPAVKGHFFFICAFFFLTDSLINVRLSLFLRLYFCILQYLGSHISMNWSFVFFFNSILLGAGLAMDAFSVSLADGLHEPKMKIRKMCLIAGVFALFQAAMPMIGWVCIHTIVEKFKAFETLIPWIALALLSYIGGKMIYDSRCEAECPDCVPKLTVGLLLTQGIASSVIESDVAEGPLQSAMRNAVKYGTKNKMSFHLSDGVKDIPRDFDTMVCAGMGADTMISILEAAPWLKDRRYRLVLQCQSRRQVMLHRLKPRR